MLASSGLYLSACYVAVFFSLTVPVVFLVRPSLTRFTVVVLSVSLSFFVTSVAKFLPSVITGLSATCGFLGFSLVSAVLPRIVLPSKRNP